MTLDEQKGRIAAISFSCFALVMVGAYMVTDSSVSLISVLCAAFAGAFSALLVSMSPLGLRLEGRAQPWVGLFMVIGCTGIPFVSILSLVFATTLALLSAPVEVIITRSTEENAEEY